MRPKYKKDSWIGVETVGDDERIGGKKMFFIRFSKHHCRCESQKSTHIHRTGQSGMRELNMGILTLGGKGWGDVAVRRLGPRRRHSLHPEEIRARVTAWKSRLRSTRRGVWERSIVNFTYCELLLSRQSPITSKKSGAMCHSYRHSLQAISAPGGVSKHQGRPGTSDPADWGWVTQDAAEGKRQAGFQEKPDWACVACQAGASDEEGGGGGGRGIY